MKILLILVMLAGVAEAGWSLRKVERRRSVCINCQPNQTTVVRKREVKREVTKTVTPQCTKSPTQCLAEQKAAYMARHRLRGHVLRHLGFGAGNFEGCGWSSGGTPGTCTPRRGTLLADAISVDRYGHRYRVRIWRR